MKQTPGRDAVHDQNVGTLFRQGDCRQYEQARENETEVSDAVTPVIDRGLGRIRVVPRRR